MPENTKVVDFLDLRIRLPEGTGELFSEWLQDFEDRHDFVEIAPRLREGVLRINSTDFIAFLGYVDPARLNDLDLQRLKSTARKELEQLLLRSVSVGRQDHYKWCVAALKNLELGRYRLPESTEE